jgi:hypothetical protein
LQLADTHLVFINDKYVRGEEIDWNALFCREDVSEQLIPLLPEMPERIASMHDGMPQIPSGGGCMTPPTLPCPPTDAQSLNDRGDRQVKKTCPVTLAQTKKEAPAASPPHRP